MGRTWWIVPTLLAKMNEMSSPEVQIFFHHLLHWSSNEEGAAHANCERDLFSWGERASPMDTHIVPDGFNTSRWFLEPAHILVPNATSESFRSSAAAVWHSFKTTPMLATPVTYTLHVVVGEFLDASECHLWFTTTDTERSVIRRRERHGVDAAQHLLVLLNDELERRKSPAAFELNTKLFAFRERRAACWKLGVT